MKSKIVGTCSDCGGAVLAKTDVQGNVVLTVCGNCGKVPKNAFGQVIEMQKDNDDDLEMFVG